MSTQSLPHGHPVTPHHKPESFYERNAVALQWGIIGAAFIAACGIYWWRTQAALEAHALIQFVLANDAEDYAGIAADSAGTRAASWAKLREANGYLDSALRDAFSNREKAVTDLEKAVELLKSLKDVSGPVELKEQVLFAYARSLEMSSDGDLEPAITAYETLLKKVPETHYKRDAEERIHALEQPSAKEFYAFFAKQDPKPAAPAGPNDEKGGKKTGGKEDPLKPLTFGGGDQKSPLDAGPGFPLPPTLLDKNEIPEDDNSAIPEAVKPGSSKKEAATKEGQPAEDKTVEPKPGDEPKPESKGAEDASPEEKKSEEKKPEEKKPAAESVDNAVEKEAAPEKPATSTPEDSKTESNKPVEGQN